MKVGFFLLLLSLGVGVSEPNPVAPLIQEIGVDQKLGSTIPSDLKFVDTTGRTVTLGELWRGKPSILVFVYFECPSLCTMVLNGLFKTLKEIQLGIGKDYSVVAVSINPNEKAALGERKRANYLKTYLSPADSAGIHFLTGDQASIQAATQAAGVRYVKDPKSNLYAHPGAFTVLTPQGKISRYFFGVDFPSKDVRMALVEASSGKIGNVIDHFLLYCYKYDPTVGRYGLVITRFLKLLGVLTMVGIGLMVVALMRWERRKRALASKS